MRGLTVARLMRTDVPKARVDMTLSEFMQAYPAQSSNQWVALTDRMERYAGIVFVPDVHLEAGAGESALAEVAKMPKQAFEQIESEALVVLDNEKDRRIIGLLTEAHVLRRYTDELAKAHRDLMGENWFSGRL
jgi:chloride channel protein, CIC family